MPSFENDDRWRRAHAYLKTCIPQEEFLNYAAKEINTRWARLWADALRMGTDPHMEIATWLESVCPHIDWRRDIIQGLIYAMGRPFKVYYLGGDGTPAMGYVRKHFDSEHSGRRYWQAVFSDSIDRDPMYIPENNLKVEGIHYEVGPE